MKILISIIMISVAACGGKKNSREQSASSNPASDLEQKEILDDGSDSIENSEQLSNSEEVTALTCTDPPKALPSRVWRLTSKQYKYVIEDLVDKGLANSLELLDESTSHDFGNESDQLIVSEFFTSQYQTAAIQIAQFISQSMLSKTGCNPATPTVEIKSCISAFISSFGLKLYRRPVESSQITDLLNIFNLGASTSNQVGLSLMLEAMFQAPNFIYRSELGAATGNKLDSYELASLLSFSLWNSVPDEILLAKAADLSLMQNEVLLGELNRMLADPRTKRMSDVFVETMFGVSQVQELVKDSIVYPTFSSNLADSMAQETKTFAFNVMLAQKGTFADLFLANYSYLDANLAQFYGVSAPATSFAKTTLPTSKRQGILTHAGVLSVFAQSGRSDPIKRGLLVRENLFCQKLELPANLEIPELMDTSGLSGRELFAAHSASPACASCHNLIDPIGFGFEKYDGIGAYRELDAGSPIDTSGQINGTLASNGTFDGAIELSNKLAKSTDAQDCMAEKFYKYLVGRHVENPDICRVKAVQSDFRKSGLFVDLIIEILTSDWMLTRSTNTEPEGT